MAKREVIYVDDIATANIMAALCDEELKGKAFNVCTGSAVTNNEKGSISCSF